MLQLRSFNRFQAFAAHIGVSLGIALLCAGLVFLVWYPGLLAQISKVTHVFLILLAVDVILGPLMTLIVFNPKKKELNRDLTVIGLIQLLALLYGMYSLFIARPVYFVYNESGYDLVYANEVKPENLSKASSPQFKSLPLFGPQVIAAQLPNDAGEAQKIMAASFFGGDDVQHMPQYHMPYQQRKAEVIEHARPLSELEQANPRKKQQVLDLTKKYADQKIEAAYLPLRAGLDTYVVTVDKVTGEVLELVDLQSRRTFPKEKPDQQKKKS